MKILPLNKRLLRYLSRHNIKKRFEKQKHLFEENPFHSSLHTEILKPKHLNIYSFRITHRYRAIFIYRGSSTIEIIDINDHYQQLLQEKFFLEKMGNISWLFFYLTKNRVDAILDLDVARPTFDRPTFDYFLFLDTTFRRFIMKVYESYEM